MLFYKAMKKILIVDVPDGHHYEQPVYDVYITENAGIGYLQRCKCKELTLPTDEEIEKENFTEGDEYAEQSYLLAEGAKWLKYKILDQ